MKPSQIGLFGLGVMGRNLALNLEEHGNNVSVYNRQTDGEEHILTSFLENDGHGKNFDGQRTVAGFISSIESPRKVLIMVKAGQPVDDVIQELLPHLENGDILIDGGNSHFEDTERRYAELSAEGINFVGMGVSGGEEGARFGPSMMPGTTSEIWNQLKRLLEPISAQAFNGTPCVTRIGKGGAGHFVKMVHNGIEYADMQLIAEAYHIMKVDLEMDHKEMSDQFKKWNSGRLASYLFEITADILKATDTHGEPLIESILDSAGQKGTGKWTAITALKNGVPLPGITDAVTARFISSFTELRASLSETLPSHDSRDNTDKAKYLDQLADSLLASRIMCHAEGFFMITEINQNHNWGIKPGDVARIWQGGCIIRSTLLKTIVSAFEEKPDQNHLLESETIATLLKPLQMGWRQTISRSALSGIPVPVMMSSLAQYDSLRSARLPANLIQAQRDYFGAHTYERTDKPRGKFFHTDWTDGGESPP